METKKLFIDTLVGQIRALDQFGTWANKSDKDLIEEKYIKTKEDLKNIPIIADIDNDKKNKFAYYINGAAHYQMMDYRTAIEKFNLALGIDPNMSNALFALGMCYKNLNEFDEAIQIFERVMNIDAGNKMALFEIKQIEKLKGMDSSTA